MAMKADIWFEFNGCVSPHLFPAATFVQHRSASAYARRQRSKLGKYPVKNGQFGPVGIKNQLSAIINPVHVALPDRTRNEVTHQSKFEAG
jgi:hypothetical protein